LLLATNRSPGNAKVHDGRGPARRQTAQNSRLKFG